MASTRVAAPDGRPAILVTTRAEWREWLAANHSASSGIWLVTYKKSTGKARLEYEQIVEEALCFGWVDSKPGKLDDRRSMLWVSPRKPKSGWSKINKERVARLEREGLMAPPGRAAVEAAQRNGGWGALDDVEALEMPDDLRRALARNDDARRYFDEFPPSSRKIILTWIAGAKRPQTRNARIEETVRLAAQNIRANHWRAGRG